MKTVLLSVLAFVVIFTLSAKAAEIHDVARGGHLAAVKTLLSENPDLVSAIDEKGRTPLHLASAGGHLEVVRFLLEMGADINAVNEKNGLSVVDVAIQTEMLKGSLNLVPYLISRGAEFDVNKKNRFGFTWLDMAIIFGNTDGAKYMIELGADIESVRRDGRTPLVNAIRRGRPQIARLLIEAGADLDVPDSEGNPPIRWAVEKGLAEIVAMLLANGTDVDFVENGNGRTLLHIAALKGYKDLVDILLAKGSDANAKDSHDRTPLFYAAKYGHKMVADLLTEHGAEKEGDMEENFGRSPHLRRQLGDKEAVAWYLNNRGWAVKTKNHMLIFDSEEFGVRRPTEPSLANGFITPSEIGDQNVFAIYTCYHGEPGEPAYVHQIEDSVASITYVHNQGDRWRGSEKTIYMEPRGNKKLGDLEIVSISIQESMPVLGYLCKVDSMTIFYSGFQPEDIEKYRQEIDFLARHASEVDIAFLPIAEPGQEDSASMYFLEKLHPRAILPLDPDRREHLFPDLTKVMAEKGFTSINVLCAENPGDQFRFQGSEGE